MERFDSNNFRPDLISEFQKLDHILEAFQNQFNVEVLNVVKELFPHLVYNEELETLAMTYANQIFNTADSIVDKDSNYSQERLADEVQNMNRVVRNYSEAKTDNREVADRIHQKAKEVMVNFNPNLMDLSADGFRLLEKYTLMYNVFFMEGLLVLTQKVD